MTNGIVDMFIEEYDSIFKVCKIKNEVIEHWRLSDFQRNFWGFFLRDEVRF